MENKSIFSLDIHPLKIVALLGIIMLLGIALSTSLSESETSAWEVAFTFLLLYAMVASILSLNTKDQNNYWLMSLIGYVLIATIGGGAAYWISGFSINDIGSLKYMYLVFTFGFLVLLTILRTMRKIIELAQKQDARIQGNE